MLLLEEQETNKVTEITKKKKKKKKKNGCTRIPNQDLRSPALIMAPDPDLDHSKGTHP